jgi:hypothetical protein
MAEAWSTIFLKLKEGLMRIVVLTLIATIVACNHIQNNTNAPGDSIISKTEANKSSINPVKTDFTKDTLIAIQFPSDSSSITVTGKMNGINNPVTVYVPVSKGNLLTVLLNPEDSTANIRINQLFTPDGKADGPFGKSLTRKVTQTGNYTLIIGENLMQGDEWKGTFTLTVRVE